MLRGETLIVVVSDEKGEIGKEEFPILLNWIEAIEFVNQMKRTVQHSSVETTYYKGYVEKIKIILA